LWFWRYSAKHPVGQRFKTHETTDISPPDFGCSTTTSQFTKIFARFLGQQYHGRGFGSGRDALFGEELRRTAPVRDRFGVSGKEGLEMVAKPWPKGGHIRWRSWTCGCPRLDGIETVARIWQEYPDLQVVICTRIRLFVDDS